MSQQWRSRLASITTTLILVYIFYRVLDRLLVVIWVRVEWWGLLIFAFVLYLLIDYLVRRAFKA